MIRANIHQHTLSFGPRASWYGGDNILVHCCSYDFTHQIFYSNVGVFFVEYSFTFDNILKSDGLLEYSSNEITKKEPESDNYLSKFDWHNLSFGEHDPSL
jgi:hypothetical protein